MSNFNCPRACKRLYRLLIATISVSVLTACLAPATPSVISLMPDKITPSHVLEATPLRFDLPGGESLVARVWATPDPRHIVLGVHGFNDYSKAFEPLAQHLAGTLGATFYAYDQRGFGANPKPGIWPGSNVLLADLRHIAAQLRSKHPGLSLTVVGESMGGALVWVAAAELPGLAADNIVLKAPAVWGENSMPWYQRFGLKFMNAVAPNMTLTGQGAQSLGITPTNDPDVVRDMSRDPLFIKATRVSSLAGVTGLMGRAQNLSTTPTQRSLILYGLQDRIIPPAPVCDWLTHLNTSGVQSERLDFVIYPKGWHLLTRQLQSREVLQDVQQWLLKKPLDRRQNPQQAQESVCTQNP